MTTRPVLLDCTLRDGGYYTAWDFSPALVAAYLDAMRAARIDVVELGFRFLANRGFKGPAAYTTDAWLDGLGLRETPAVAVMVNGADLLTDLGLEATLERLFPRPADETPVSMVRFACHLHECEGVLPAADWLAKRGYRVGFNLMQISERTEAEVTGLARRVSDFPVEVLYVADSLGSLLPADAARIMGWMRAGWAGPLGVHTHDNMGLALRNSLAAIGAGASWIDSTVTGMGRGPGNARTEEVLIETAEMRPDDRPNLVPLMALIRRHFGPMKAEHGWGTNPWYYLAGKHGIHPTYIQQMLGDPRYDEEDILAVIEHLRREGGTSFSRGTLEGARQFYSGPPAGTWQPAEAMAGREVLILGTGPGVAAHRTALEAHVRRHRPLVIALNTQEALDPALIDLRIACHPVRLLADCEAHAALPQPLVTPASMLPAEVVAALGAKPLLDYGLAIEPGRFAAGETHCTLPAPLVLAYALAVVTAGGASRVLMAGFDGYPPGDPRNAETAEILRCYRAHLPEDRLLAITPTRHELQSASIYGM